MKIKDKTVFSLEGRPKFWVALPLGMQHILAMFVSNVAPILIITGIVGLEPALTRVMVQAAMFTSAVATLLNVYGVKIGNYQIGSRLPIVMGTSFAFVGVAGAVGAELGLGAVIGAAISAAVLEIIIGIFYKKIKRLLNPLVTGSLLIALGLYLINVGANYFIGGFGPNRGTPESLIVATVVLLVSLGIRIFGKGLLKSSAILIAIVVGYLISIPMGLVSFGNLGSLQFLSFQNLIPLSVVRPEFVPSAIISFAVVYFASSVETIGDIKGVAVGGLNREATDEELSGGLLADGIGSIFSVFFNGLPNTSFGQNVGIVSSTKVVNRNVVGIGAMFLIVVSFFPQVSEIIRLIPDAVMGGALLTVFAIIAANGIKVLAQAGASENNLFILALSLGIGLGLGGNQAFLDAVPSYIGFLFSTTVSATAITAIIASLIIKPDWSKGTYNPDDGVKIEITEIPQDKEK